MFSKKHLILLAMAAIVVAWFLMLRPASLGGPSSYVMVSGRSMEPTLYTGDLAVVRKHGSYHPGDIVAFRVPRGDPGEGAVVIHRIAGVTADGGFIVQGDNKKHPDPWHPSEDDIVGKMWFSVPSGARLINMTRTPAVLAALAACGAVIFVLTDGRGGKRKPGIDPSSVDRASASTRGRTAESA